MSSSNLAISPKNSYSITNMSIKQTIRNVMAGLFLLMGVTVFLTPVASVSAVSSCGGVQTSIITCDDKTDKNNNGNIDVEETGVWGLLLLIINILTAGVGVLAVGGIVYGSILYTSAGGNQEQVKKAMGIFTNVVVGVIAFAGMWALLNFIVPGGVFK